MSIFFRRSISCVLGVLPSQAALSWCHACRSFCLVPRVGFFSVLSRVDPANDCPTPLSQFILPLSPIPRSRRNHHPETPGPPVGSSRLPVCLDPHLQAVKAPRRNSKSDTSLGRRSDACSTAVSDPPSAPEQRCLGWCRVTCWLLRSVRASSNGLHGCVRPMVDVLTWMLNGHRWRRLRDSDPTPVDRFMLMVLGGLDRFWFRELFFFFLVRRVRRTCDTGGVPPTPSTGLGEAS